MAKESTFRRSVPLISALLFVAAPVAAIVAAGWLWSWCVALALSVTLAIIGFLRLWSNSESGFPGFIAQLRRAGAFSDLLMLWAGLLLVSVSAVLVPMTFRGVQPPSGIGAHLLSVPGSLFTAFLGLVTFIGFLVTLSRLRDVEWRAVGYPELHNLVARVVTNEVERAQKTPGAFVYIMANAPAFGNLSAPRTFRFLHDALEKAAETPGLKMQVLCLDWTVSDSGQTKWAVPLEDPGEGTKYLHLPHPSLTVQSSAERTPMGRFYLQLAGWLKDKDKSDANDGMWQALSILELVGNMPSFNKGDRDRTARVLWAATLPQATGEGSEQASRVPLHFVLTSKQCLLFTTLDLPPEAGTTGDGAPYVDIVAFLTTDRGMTRCLERAFDHYTNETRGFARRVC